MTEEIEEGESGGDLAREARRQAWSESWVLLAIGALLSADLLADDLGGRSRLHFGLELSAALLVLAGVAWVWARSIRARRRLSRRLLDLQRASPGPLAR